MTPGKCSAKHYVRVKRNEEGVFACPGCSLTQSNYKKLYNHYYIQSGKNDPKHPGLLRRCQYQQAEVSPEGQCVGGTSQGRFGSASKLSSEGDSNNVTFTPSQDQALGSTPAAFSELVEQSSAAAPTQAIVDIACPVSVHQLPKECRSSVLVHGYLQKKVPLQQLQAAAAMENCCSGTEAWLDASTIHSIRRKALIELHPDKNPGQDPTQCNNIWNNFQDRINNLLHTTWETNAFFWEHLQQESVAAVAYLSFCDGWKQGCKHNVVSSKV